MSTDTKRETILNVALELFSKRGYDGVGVKEIVDKAGVTKPTLYYFFKNKEGVYTALWDFYYSPFIDELKKIAKYEAHPQQYEEDVFPQLCKIVRIYYSFAKKNPTFFRLMLSMQFSPEDATGIGMMQRIYRMQFSLMESFFSQISKEHGNVKGKEELLSHIFIASVFEGISEKIDDEKLVKIFMHGIF